MFIDYTPKRKLVNGSSGELHSDAQDVNRESKDIANQKQSLAGNLVTTLTRIEDTITIKSGWIDTSEMPLWKEFHASVAGGESFTLDPEGVKAVPNDPITAKLKTGSFKFKRESAQYFTVSFKVFEV
jgi:hypothetical protein